MNESYKKKKIYHRAYSGMIKSDILKMRTFFITLTSSPVTVEGLDWDQRLELIQHNWNILRNRIENKYGKLEYFSVRVPEAYGVIHILYRGDFKVSQRWLSNAWNEIHGSMIVDVRPTYKGLRGSASYLVSQYLKGQCGRVILGMSRNWIYKGCINEYNELKKVCRDFSKQWVNKWNVICAPLDREMLFRDWKNLIEYRCKDAIL